MIKLGKFCLIKTKFEPNLSYFIEPVSVVSSAYVTVSASNVKVPPRKYAMKKRMLIFGEYLHRQISLLIQTLKTVKKQNVKNFCKQNVFLIKDNRKK